MNIYDSQELNEEKEKSKRLIKLIGIALIVSFVIAMIILGYIKYIDMKQLKLFVNGQKVNLGAEVVMFDEEDNPYISINEIAKQIGYKTNKGEYATKYLEDETKCYLENEFEAVSYIKDSNEIYKVITAETGETNEQPEEIDYEYFTIDKPVVEKNNKLYVTLSGLAKGCNLYQIYENNRIYIYTLNNFAQTQNKKNTTTPNATSQKMELSEYKNNKALLYDRKVTESEEGIYGVDNLKGETIIGQKYADILFNEEAQEFLVETEDGQIGIIDINGKTKIKPEYSSVKLIDKDKELFLVSKKSTDSSSSKEQYGIIDKNENIIVYLDYEQIGIKKSDFPNDNIKNAYILYGKYIPVKKSNKWELLDLNGNTVLPAEYDDFGCKSNTSKNALAKSLLIIPEYEAIVVNRDKQYGLFNMSGKELIPALVTDMYVINSSGENKYYLTWQGEERDVIDYLQNVLGIEPVVKNVNKNR